jgi:hypothetical protein
MRSGKDEDEEPDEDRGSGIGDSCGYNPIMLKQVLAAFAVWTIVVGCCFLLNETATRAADDGMAAAAPAPPPSPPQPPSSPIGIQPEPSAAQQMQALDRHARVNMICYPGSFGGPDQGVPAIALDVMVRLK